MRLFFTRQILQHTGLQLTIGLLLLFSTAETQLEPATLPILPAVVPEHAYPAGPAIQPVKTEDDSSLEDIVRTRAQSRCNKITARLMYTDPGCGGYVCLCPNSCLNCHRNIN